MQRANILQWSSLRDKIRPSSIIKKEIIVLALTYKSFAQLNVDQCGWWLEPRNPGVTFIAHISRELQVREKSMGRWDAACERDEYAAKLSPWSVFWKD